MSFDEGAVKRVASRHLAARSGGRARYKGREYKVLFVGPTRYGERARLQFLDGSKDFWVDANLVEMLDGGSVAPPKRTPTPRRPPPAPGERTVSKKPRGRNDGYEVGDVLHLTRVTGGGGPDGRWWVVLETWKAQDPDDDEWMAYARVRPATDAEALPLAKGVDLRKAREDMLRELDSIVKRPANHSWTPPVPFPRGKEITLHQTMAGGSRYVVGDHAVVFVSSSYDDGPNYWLSTDPRAIELGNLLAG